MADDESRDDDWGQHEEGYPRMSKALGTLIRLHEAAHAVFHTVLEKTECTEIQVGGSLQFEEGYTFSLIENADPPKPMALAVAAMAGPVANALFGELDTEEERRWLSRGTTGDYVKAVAVLSGDHQAVLNAWDIAVDLLEALRPHVRVVAGALEGKSGMRGDEVGALVSATPVGRLPHAEGLGLLKPEIRQRWQAEAGGTKEPRAASAVR